MAKIQIKNIGPISDTGTIDLKTLNIFIGKQCTGKSTVLKILSFCRWIEKRLCMKNLPDGSSAKESYSRNSRFIKELSFFYRFDLSFFTPNSEIIYHGDTHKISFKGSLESDVMIEEIEGAQPYNAKLCFVPSERNLVSAIKGIESWYRTRDFDYLFNFIFEWDELRKSFTRKQPLSLTVVPELEYYYDVNKGDKLHSKSGNNPDFSPFYASSGIQSSLPLEVVMRAVCEKVGTQANLSKTDLRDIVAALLQDTISGELHTASPTAMEMNQDKVNLAKSLLTYQGAAFFIEEPEQNLFPEAQANLLNSIVRQINKANAKGSESRSMATIATHSPYLLSSINVLMAASEAYEKDPKATERILHENDILPKGEITAYYFSEDGNVKSIIDNDIYMIDGYYLDTASMKVEDQIDRLNDIICK